TGPLSPWGGGPRRLPAQGGFGLRITCRIVRARQPGEVAVAEEEKLKLGKGAAFVKSRISRLPESGETWEADVEALPKPMTEPETASLGLVVAKKGGTPLSALSVQSGPSVNDLATLLAHAMRRPLDGNARRPKLVHLRGHRQWKELFPVLEGLGIGVSVE